MIKNIIKNPISIWLYLLYNNYKIKKRNKNLRIGYLCYINNSLFGEYNTVYDRVSLSNVSLGDFTYVSDNSTIKNTQIGKFCSIGPNCKIGLGIHPSSVFVSTHPIFYSTSKQTQISFSDKNYFVEHKTIIIGNDVWIGANVLISDGVNIGDGAIIAAGAVVTKDIHPYSIVGGVPAKELRKRFDDNKIDQLLRIKWWNNEAKILQDNFLRFHNINTFLKYYDK